MRARARWGTAAARFAGVTMLLATLPAEGQRISRTGGSRPGIDVLHYHFTVDFSHRALDDTLQVTSTLTVRRFASADSLVLDLREAMRVQAVLVNGRAVHAGRDSATVRVPLPPGVHDTLQVTVNTRGLPVDGLIIRRDSAGAVTAFADHFPNRARQWLATVDHPSDKATVEWSVRTPATHRVIANGALLEETPIPAADGRSAMLLTRWRAVRPLYTAVMVIGVAPFARVELGNTACGLGELPGCVPQSLWVTPDVRDDLPGPFSRAAEMVALYARLIGPFPYEKLAHVQSSTRYGGMENASAIFYADKIFRERTMSEQLIAHETVHQWFGDAVTTREWPHVWLSEGFATYFAAIWAESSRGDTALVNALKGMRDDVLRSPVTAEKAVVDTALNDLGRVLNTNVYEKAGFTLHMLRRHVGDSAFFRAVRAYYARHRHGNALTDDFVHDVEAASGERLDWFFDQWLRRPGVADLTVRWRWEAGQQALVLTVSQGGRGAPYRLTLSVDVTDASGRTQRLRVPIPAARVATIPVKLGLDGGPRAVVFDADASVLGTITASP